MAYEFNFLEFNNIEVSIESLRPLNTVLALRSASTGCQDFKLIRLWRDGLLITTCIYTTSGSLGLLTSLICTHCMAFESAHLLIQDSAWHPLWNM
jgi:hypothetical protein